MSTRLSRYFTLEDLTKTSQKGDNTPNVTQLENLKRLAILLDEIYDKIGPFRIESGFRSSQVNDALSKTNTQVSATSLHMTGEAADIIPITSTVNKFMANLIKNAPLFAKVGELYKKTTVIHLTLATPLKRSVAGQVVNNQYEKFSTQQIKDFVDKNAAAIGIGSIAVIGVGAYYLTKGKI